MSADDVYRWYENELASRGWQSGALVVAMTIEDQARRWSKGDVIIRIGIARKRRSTPTLGLPRRRVRDYLRDRADR